MSSKPPRGAPVAIYARHSTARLPNIPIEDQIRHLLAQARKHGWEPVQVFRDPAASSAVQRNASQDDGGPEGGE